MRRVARQSRWLGEIFCRATLRYGELSKAETKEQGRRTDKLLPSAGKKSKAEKIKASGLSTSAAHRAEALAGARSDLDDQMGSARRWISWCRRTCTGGI
jgi:hypothetical protein